jgi:hypothetical protein
LPAALATIESNFAGGIEYFVAHGFGRSYGMESSFLGKKIPGIFSSGLWSDFDDAEPLPTIAWITDVGNDLAYEIPPAVVANWVESCVDRLAAAGARIVLADLPLESLARVGEANYRRLRRVLFPSCRLGLAELLDRAAVLSKMLGEFAERRQIPIFKANGAWYGFDPIHPRRRHWGRIWQQLVAPMVARVRPTSHTFRSLWFARYVRDLRRRRYRWLSISLTAQQPNGVLRSGSTIALY